MIVVIDCGMGNLQSVIRGLNKAGGDAVVSSRVDDVAAAQKIILPGVGSLGHGMESLRRQELMPVLTQKVLGDKTPVLGICVGHQMLTAFSEESDVDGLGWIDAKTTRLPETSQAGPVKIPHMGWNTLTVHKECPLLQGVPEDACFYFAHSYSVAARDNDAIVATTDYGCSFVSIVQKENVFGVQFHPEKSQANGITILRNFLNDG